MNRFKHAKWWRSYLDKLKKGFWKFTGLNFKWKHEHKQWRRGKQSEENRGQQLQSSFTLLEHFPKSIFYMLYTISKLRKSKIQCFKRCVIWSWNEGVTAIASRSLQAEGSILQSVAKSAFCCENFVAFLHSAMELLLKLPDICTTLEAEHLKLEANFAALRV